MFKQFYRRFLEANPDTLNFAAHSHHYWPDVTRDAMLQYWDDSARLVGHKWDHVFGTVVPAAQRHVATALGLAAPEQIVFGASTHEFVCRLLSCFPVDRPIRLLTTDGEFYSFRRQMLRLAEDDLVRPTIVPTEPVAEFADRMKSQLAQHEFDLVCLSHAFFNSGFVVTELDEILDAVDFDRTQVLIDAYHVFCALPVSYAKHGARLFVTGGGYKYAQAGEGACFLSVPAGTSLRPRNTGWFAEFDSLEAGQPGGVGYRSGGQRFAGATYDPTGTYRLNAAMDLLQQHGISIADVHAHVVALQSRFLERLSDSPHRLLTAETLLFERERSLHGHFLTFELPDAPTTARLAGQLANARVEIDYRGNRMRFGFGLYQDVADVDELFDRIGRLA